MLPPENEIGLIIIAGFFSIASPRQKINFVAGNGLMTDIDFAI